MRQYKKRIIAISLASVMTVLGSFGAENYKNTIMSMDFKQTESGMNMTIYTVNNYSYPLKYSKNGNTYEIILDETNYDTALRNKKIWPSGISSVNMATTPYTPDNHGTTNITVTLASDLPFHVVTALYLPNSTPTTPAITDQHHGYSTGNTTNSNTSYSPVKKKSYWDDDDKNEKVVSTKVKKEAPATSVTNIDEISKGTEPYNKTVPATNKKKENQKEQAVNVIDYSSAYDSDPRSRMYAVIGMLVIVLLILILVFWSKERMASLTGVQSKYDFDNDKRKKTRQKPAKKLKSNIPPQENVYTKTEPVPDDSSQSQDYEKAEEVNVIDLDALYNETAQQNKAQEQIPEPEKEEDDDETNTALDDFLSEFYSEEENIDIPAENAQTPEEEPFDEQLYENCIKDNNLSFTTSDIKKINSLLQNEISEDSMTKRAEYIQMMEAKKNAPTKEQMLEDFVATYFVKQDIYFTKEDIDALQKLMNVELDEDFIKDLRTNPIRTKEMHAELSKRERKPHIINEQILKVKNLLPNLSEELKKHGNKRIQSDAKPQVVYFSEGYEYTKLEVDKSALDLNNINAAEELNSFRPSDMPQIAEYGYDVQTLNVKNVLPDLDDVKANPSKYKEPENTKPVADETALLNSIANVTFKPFFEEPPIFNNTDEQFDNDNIILDLDALAKQATPQIEEIPVSPIFNENEEEITPNIPPQPEENPEVTVIDENKENLTENIIPQPEMIKINTNQNTTENSAPRPEKVRVKRVENRKIPDNILPLLEKTHTAKDNKTTEKAKPQPDKIAAGTTVNKDKKEKIQTEKRTPKIPEYPQNCNYEGNTYKVIKVANCSSDAGCYLAKGDNGYTVFGFIKDKLYKLNSYDELKSENLQLRANEKMQEGKAQYIVKVSTHKFLMQLVSDKMELVMNLC